MTRRELLAMAGLAARPMPRPTPAQLAWQDFELGLIFCLDLPVFAPGGWTPAKSTFDPNLYRPTKFDTDQWMEAAKAMGCRYAIFTATHFNGFLQWQSDLYPYGLKQSAWRRGKADVFGDFVRSCHKYGIAPGVFLSSHRNAWQKVWGHRVNWGAGGPEQAAFAKIGERMTEELVSRYGPLCEVWYDAGLLDPHGGGPDVLPVIDKYQKNTVFYHSSQRREHRWIGNENGIAGEPCWSTMPDLATADRAHRESGNKQNRELLLHGDPDGKLWSPGMVDVPNRNHEWFWRPGDEHKLFQPDALVEMYYQSVGRNCTFILGAVPDTDGLIPEPDFRIYSAFGKEIGHRFSNPVAEAASSELKLPRPSRIDHVCIMEEIAQGERIREYAVEGLTGPDRWSTLARGESVGHKWIHRFAPVEVAAVRLRVIRSTAPPLIRKLAVYRIS